MRRTSSWRNLRLMRLDDCYRLLDLPPGASDEEVKRAYRDLTKVWHPDRFSHDARLRQIAEEKLKGINEAYETLRATRDRGWQGKRRRASRRPAPGDGDPSSSSDRGGWRVRWPGREIRVDGLQAIVTLVERGAVGKEAEVFDPAAGKWTPLAGIPELSTALTRGHLRRNRNYALTCTAVAVFILLRRPTPAGLVISLALVCIAFFLVARMRRAARVPSKH